MAFAVILVLTDLALSTPAQALTCGVPGTENMPTCSAQAAPGQVCCVPPQYKGVKTVATSGNKAPVMHHVPINPAAATVSATVPANNNEPADYVPAPSNVVSVSVTEITSAQTAPVQMSAGPAAPATPATPAATTASASKAVKGAPGSKSK